MGGHNPVGYHRVNKELLPYEDELSLVTMIFERYLALGCVRLLKRELKEKNILSPKWKSSKGIERGGNIYSRGALYAILSNPVYIGKIRHKSKVYDDLHAAIIDISLWDKVQKKLEDNKISSKAPTKQHYLLQGKIFDEKGTRYTPRYTLKKGRRYSYYISQNIIQDRDHPNNLIGRLPGNEIEDLARKTIGELLVTPTALAAALNVDQAEHFPFLKHATEQRSELNIDEMIRAACQKILLTGDTVRIKIDSKAFAETLKKFLKLDIPIVPTAEFYEIDSGYYISKTRKGAITVDAPSRFLAKDDPFNRADHKVQNWVKGIAWRDMHFTGMTISEIASRENVGTSYVSRLIDQSFETR